MAGMYCLHNETKQPRASAPWLPLGYNIACKLTMSRRTPRINTFAGVRSIYKELDRASIHQSCVSFLKKFSGLKCNTAFVFPSSY